MANPPVPDMAEALCQAGYITSEQLTQARFQAASTGSSVVQTLVSAGMVDKNALLRLAADTAGVPFVELADVQVDPTAAAMLSADFVKRFGILPYALGNGELIVAVPLKRLNDLELKDDIGRLARRHVQFNLAAKPDIETKINQVYRATDELSNLSTELVSEQDDVDSLENFTEIADDAPVVRFVNLIIGQAITDRASDIHLEPTETELRVRYRIDGVLTEAHSAPRSIINGVVSRLKIMSGMNIAERRIPQDGRLTVANPAGGTMDLRIASLPTVWGEKIVGRVLDNTNTSLSLDDLGFGPANRARFAQSYAKPYGMILVTGPTGSGKSTTLYATLNILNKPEVNVITVEDPVEYRLAGINQVQTNNKAGLTFASALRSILRSDPDIVLIGEIRDHETANIAVEAALTGHLVLTTLHTNDAPSAITRLVEMGIEPFLVGSALDCVVAQRLCRALCPKCKEAYEPDRQELAQLGFVIPPDGPESLYRPVGCSSCAGTGYRGRMALHEVMAVDEGIERLTVARASADQLNESARASGMTSLREDGWQKVLSGRTSVEEILRVVV